MHVEGYARMTDDVTKVLLKALGYNIMGQKHCFGELFTITLHQRSKKHETIWSVQTHIMSSIAFMHCMLCKPFLHVNENR